MVTDPIANMLVTIKNVQDAGRAETTVYYSSVKEAIAKTLTNSGYLKGRKIVIKEGKKQLVLALGDKKISQIKRISKPGHRVFRKSNNIPKPMGGLALIIISTSQGIMSGADAKIKGLGGELICEVN